MRLAPALTLLLAVATAACGTPPVDAGRRAPATPPLRGTPEPPPAAPAAVAATPDPPPPPPPAPEPPPTPRGSITLRSVYPAVSLTEWELANGGHVLFERRDGEPLRLLAVATGGAAGLDAAVAARVRGAVAARRPDPRGRFELGDVSRRVVAEATLPSLGAFLRSHLGLGSADPSTPFEGPPFNVRTAPPVLSVEAAFELEPVPAPVDDERVVLDAFGRPGDYVVAVVGDAEVEAVEAYVAGAFGAGGRAPLAFDAAAPRFAESSSVVDAGTGRGVSTLVYRGRLRRGDTQARIELAAYAAVEALGGGLAAWGRADEGTGTYEIALAVGTTDRGELAEVADRLASADAPGELGHLRWLAVQHGRGGPQHLVNWHVRDGSPLRYESYERALGGVSRSELAETMQRVFGGGAYRAVLGLDLTP